MVAQDSTVPLLSEDDIDDVLYYARANESQELLNTLENLSGDKLRIANILNAAIDSGNGNSALHYAAANGHTGIIRLIESSFIADNPRDRPDLTTFVNLPNKAGNTALHWASLNGHLSTVQLLVTLGADHAAMNVFKHSAAFEAENDGQKEVADWLHGEGQGTEQETGQPAGTTKQIDDGEHSDTEHESTSVPADDISEAVSEMHVSDLNLRSNGV